MVQRGVFDGGVVYKIVRRNKYIAVLSHGVAVLRTQRRSSYTGTLQLDRYQGSRWPQAARWAQCTCIDIHFFSGKQKTISSISSRHTLEKSDKNVSRKTMKGSFNLDWEGFDDFVCLGCLFRHYSHKVGPSSAQNIGDSLRQRHILAKYNVHSARLQACIR